MPLDQNYIDSDSSLTDGITDTFVADAIAYDSLHGEDSTINTECVEVYVGGIRQLDNYTVTASLLGGTQVVLDYVPAAGIEVTILVRRGTWWYDLSTPETRELSLQETNTPAARFLRGL